MYTCEGNRLRFQIPNLSRDAPLRVLKRWVGPDDGSQESVLARQSPGRNLKDSRWEHMETALHGRGALATLALYRQYRMGAVTWVVAPCLIVRTELDVSVCLHLQGQGRARSRSGYMAR